MKTFVSIGDMDVHLADGHIHFWVNPIAYSVHVGNGKILKAFIAALRKIAQSKKEVYVKLKGMSILSDSPDEKFVNVFIDTGASRFIFTSEVKKIEEFANYLESRHD